MEYEESQMQDQEWERGQTESGTQLDAALASFRQSLQEGTSRLMAALEPVAQIGEMIDAEVKRAETAAQRAEEAQRKVEDMQESIQRSYANLTNLAEQLQQRFAALAALAQPMDFGINPSSSEVSGEEHPPEPYNQ